MKRIVCLGLVLVAAAAFAWAADIFILRRQRIEADSIPQKIAAMQNAAAIIIANGDAIQAILTNWKADVVAGNLDQASVDKLLVYIAAGEGAKFYAQAKVFQDYWQKNPLP